MWWGMAELTIEDPVYFTEKDVGLDGTIQLGDELPEEYRGESVNVALVRVGDV